MLMRARIGRRGFVAGAGAIAVGSMVPAARAQQGTVTFSSWGGAFQDALRETMLKPAAQRLGIAVREDTTNGIQDVRAQITARRITCFLS